MDVIKRMSQSELIGEILRLDPEANLADLEEMSIDELRGHYDCLLDRVEIAIGLETPIKNWIPTDLSERIDTREMVDHPDHYVKDRKYEPYKVIRDWNLNFNLGSAVKYLARAGRKDDAIEDLKKAIEYIRFEIEELEDQLEEIEL